ncbi:MAG: site-specific integrase, partial [Candidatus Heimdallarchaeota archaeon]|nr:site-specific integrase [Candidatus Heimdallarchaeota archaeon]MCK4877773.1 site-specific integrase [Candidatus Heimdallarchaeota archaeon]
MNEEYLHFLKYKKKPSTKTLERYLKDLELLEDYLHKFKENKDIKKTELEDIEDFINWLKEGEPQSVVSCCKNIGIYFE